MYGAPYSHTSKYQTIDRLVCCGRVCTWERIKIRSLRQAEFLLQIKIEWKTCPFPCDQMRSFNWIICYLRLNTINTFQSLLAFIDFIDWKTFRMQSSLVRFWIRICDLCNNKKKYFNKSFDPEWDCARNLPLKNWT